MSELNWPKSPPASTMWRSSSVPVKTLNNTALMCMNQCSSTLTSAEYVDGNSWRMRQGSPSTADGHRSPQKRRKKKIQNQMLLIGNNATFVGKLKKQVSTCSRRDLLSSSQLEIGQVPVTQREEAPSTGVSPEAELKKAEERPPEEFPHIKDVQGCEPPPRSPLKSRWKFMEKCWE